DPRTVEGIGSSRAALENSRAGAGTGQPEPTRVPSARADEGHPKGTGRIGGFNAGNRRASQKSGRSRNAGGSQEGMRAGAEAPGENDAGFGGVYGFAHVPGMDDLAAVEQVLRRVGD